MFFAFQTHKILQFYFAYDLNEAIAVQVVHRRPGGGVIRSNSHILRSFETTLEI